MERRLGSRTEALEKLVGDRTRLDLLVVGGGISGAGVLLEATLRGYTAALVERADFAAGTSRYSTKLIHGGLRYLLQGATEFVRESLEERAFLLEHSSDLVQPLPYLIPQQSTGDPPDFVERLLSGYDTLAPASRLPPHRWVEAEELGARAPILTATDRAAEYYETQTDDARLVVAVLAAAVARGAVVANYVELVGFESATGSVRATLRDTAGNDQPFELTANGVILAVGAWLGPVGESIGFRSADLCPGKGTHVVLAQPQTRSVTTGLVVRHPSDGRLLTVTPWRGHLLLGSTDAECDPSELRQARPTAAEVEYLLEGLRTLAPDWTPHVTAAWSGVRPLLGQHGDRTTDLSREDRLVQVAPGVSAIVGGKLTTFRRLAERTLDYIESVNGRQRAVAQSFPMLTEPLHDLTGVGEPLVTGVPFGKAALRSVATHEMVSTLDDVLTGRLGVSLVEPDLASANASSWASDIAPILGWTAHERDRQVDAYRHGIERFRDPRPIGSRTT